MRIPNALFLIFLTFSLPAAATAVGEGRGNPHEQSAQPHILPQNGFSAFGGIGTANLITSGDTGNGVEKPRPRLAGIGQFRYTRFATSQLGFSIGAGITGKGAKLEQKTDYNADYSVKLQSLFLEIPAGIVFSKDQLRIGLDVVTSFHLRTQTVTEYRAEKKTEKVTKAYWDNHRRVSVAPALFAGWYMSVFDRSSVFGAFVFQIDIFNNFKQQTTNNYSERFMNLMFVCGVEIGR
ncbi:MAG: hypothetical protein JXR76_14355 [Deltaproteobacteria bacterium]|nr:hypothetical protein [Deltaproteobacteria bacterium]